MAIHQIKLIDRKEIARQTFILIFEKPIGLIFKPGQYAGFTLMHTNEIDPSGNTRRFSLLSTPGDQHLAIITRAQPSPFKKQLLSMPIGSEIKFAGPTGIFTLHEEINIPAVFIAGGIGIAPFYSMIKHACTQQFPQTIYLFYGNQTLADAALLSELTEIKKHHANFHFISVMNNPEKNYQGETGFITDRMLKKYIPDLSQPIYYICGSPAMVTALQETLAEMDINEDNIRTEDFPGY